MNCWEFRKCGRERGGTHSYELGVCPSWPKHGLECATISGTMCGGEVQGTAAQKLGNCEKCAFYQSEHYDGSCSCPSPADT